MNASSNTRRPVSRVLSTLVVGALAPALLALAPSATAAETVPAAKIQVAKKATKTKARTDKVTIVAGKSATVRVLANDKIAGKTAKAKVRVIKTPTGLTAKATRARAVTVRVAPTTKPGARQVGYLVRDSLGRKATSVITVTVKAAPPTTPPTPGNPGTPGTPGPNTLRSLVASLPVVVEHRTGYDRDLFKHWNSGANPTDGCDTRREVLLAEAVVRPTVGSGCSFAASSGGTWTSYYDGVSTTDPSKFDIDHMVPLAEAWDSGAWTWTAARREAYANDLADPRSLVAVTASSNRSKSDQDPAEWMPTQASTTCRYVAEWTVVKHRWSLSVDTTEKAALTRIASGCTDVPLAFTVVP